jgi:hypothetical protein
MIVGSRMNESTSEFRLALEYAILACNVFMCHMTEIQSVVATFRLHFRTIVNFEIIDPEAF